MNKLKSYCGKTLKVTVALAFVVWVIGGVLAGLYNNLYEKKQCIENEGWLKGVFWCSTGSASHFAANMVIGFLWPALIFHTPASEPEVDDGTKMQEAFIKTSIGTLYTCWGGALNTNREEDADTLLKAIEWMNKNIEKNRKSHIAFSAMASKVVVRLEESGDLESYYRSKCDEPTKRLRKAMERGLLEKDSMTVDGE